MLWLDGCESVVTDGRSVGGPSIQIRSADASRFGNPTEADPLRLSFFDPTAKDPVGGVLLCTGRTSSTLTISGPSPGYVDFAVEQNWIVANVPVAQDFVEFQASRTWLLPGPTLLGTGEGTEDDPLMLDVNVPEIFPDQGGNAGKGLTTDGERLGWVVFATPSDLAAKQDALPTGGTSGQFLANDLTWKTPPGPDLSGYALKTTTDALDGRLDVLEAAGYATTSYVDDGLADKADSSTVSAIDGRVTALEEAPKPLYPIARWVLASTADLTTGPASVELADVPISCVPHSVRVNAQTNSGAGGFTFNLAANGSDLFASAQSHPADSTASASYDDFALTDLDAGDLISLTIASVGSGVRNVSVTLWGLPS